MDECPPKDIEVYEPDWKKIVGIGCLGVLVLAILFIGLPLVVILWKVAWRM